MARNNESAGLEGERRKEFEVQTSQELLDHYRLPKGSRLRVEQPTEEWRRRHASGSLMDELLYVVVGKASDGGELIHPIDQRSVRGGRVSVGDFIVLIAKE